MSLIWECDIIDRLLGPVGIHYVNAKNVIFETAKLSYNISTVQCTVIYIYIGRFFFALYRIFALQISILRELD